MRNGEMSCVFMFFAEAIVNSSNYVNLIKSRTHCIKQSHDYVWRHQSAGVTSHAVLEFGFTCGISSCLLFVICRAIQMTSIFVS